jgi:hypothetical protein
MKKLFFIAVLTTLPKTYAADLLQGGTCELTPIFSMATECSMASDSLLSTNIRTSMGTPNYWKFESSTEMITNTVFFLPNEIVGGTGDAHKKIDIYMSNEVDFSADNLCVSTGGFSGWFSCAQELSTMSVYVPLPAGATELIFN